MTFSCLVCNYKNPDLFPNHPASILTQRLQALQVSVRSVSEAPEDQNATVIFAFVHSNDEAIVEGFASWATLQDSRYVVYCSSEAEVAVSDHSIGLKVVENPAAKDRIFALTRSFEEFIELLPHFCNTVNSGGNFKTFFAPGNLPEFEISQRTIPQYTIAAYLLEKAGKLDSFPAIRKMADDESNGDYGAKIDAYFGINSLRILRLAEIGVPALSLRAKVSHSWIDHEVISVKVEDAVERWRQRKWGEIAERWQILHALALKFRDELPKLSSATLVDKLTTFESVLPEEKDELKRRLDLVHGRSVDVQAVREAYSRCLDTFWRSAQEFFELTQNANAAEPAIREAWQKVRITAEDLKALFRDGTIPDGILLP